ncbi:MAG: SH3 domain-containing protein [Burkholderiaceae bacterium]
MARSRSLASSLSFLSSSSRRFVVCLFVMLAFGGMASGAASARDMVSVDGATANMRSGPGTGYRAEWSLAHGYPLRVVGRQGNWLKVSDFEKDVGWVHRSLLGNKPHHVVKASVANIRQRPTTRSPIVGRLQRGEVVETLGRQPGWIRVSADGSKGWVASDLLWGW